MSGEQEVTHTFGCPECGEDLEVNGPMKDALIENGCVLCGSIVTAEAFVCTSPSES